MNAGGCCCTGKNQEDSDNLDLKLSGKWLRIAVAGVFAGQSMVLSLALNMTPPPYGSRAYWILHGGLILSSLVVMAFLGGPLFRATWNMIRHRRLLIEGLFTLSLSGAFFGSVIASVSGEGAVFYEIVAIVIAIYTFGQTLSGHSKANLKRESARLRESLDQATVLNPPDGWMSVPVASVEAGAIVRVDPGEAITVDGRILKGIGYVRETALTGELLPIVKRAGDRVRAGTYSIDSQFELEVLSSSRNRELDTILDMVESGDGRPSRMQVQADELVRYFLPIVAGVAGTTGIFWGIFGTWMDAALNSMAVLLVACPCALGLATPVAISQGLLRLAQFGLVSRDGALIDVLAHSRRIFFDKTGTLSESKLKVTECLISKGLPIPGPELLRAIRAVELSMNHPVARTLSHYIRSNYDDSTAEPAKPVEPRHIPGKGIEFSYKSWRIRVGEATLATDEVELSPMIDRLHSPHGKHIFVFIEAEVAACFVLQESLREGVDELWQGLESLGVEAEVLTGDPNAQLDIPDSIPVNAGMSARQKVEVVRASVQIGENPLFVGDGINDAAAMAAARGSIAMKSGVGLAHSVAMGHLSSDQVSVIPAAIRFSRVIQAKLKGNLMYAVSYNVLGMSLAAAGLLHPAVAATIMLVSSFLVSLRACSPRIESI